MKLGASEVLIVSLNSTFCEPESGTGILLYPSVGGSPLASEKEMLLKPCSQLGGTQAPQTRL